MKYFTKTGA